MQGLAFSWQMHLLCMAGFYWASLAHLHDVTIPLTASSGPNRIKMENHSLLLEHRQLGNSGIQQNSALP